MTDNMSNETKRDVFGQLLNAYQNLIDKDNEIHYEAYRENITTPWNIVYDAALPDDLPVIPEEVGKFIKAMKANGDSLFASESTVLLMEYLGLIPFDALKITEWIDKHQNTVSRAWLLETWAVEETGEIVKLEAEK